MNATRKQLLESLKRFSGDGDLREASIHFLEGLHFHLSKGSLAKYLRGSTGNLPLNKFLVPEFVEKNTSLIQKVFTISYVGVATPATFADNDLGLTLEEIEARVSEEHYKGIVFFCIDVDQELKRAEIVSLSRAFNRRMQHKPVVLFIRFGNLLTLTTCKRTISIKKSSDIIGKVSILRDINCEEDKTHPGHINILEDLWISKRNPSFDDLYDNWLKTFDCELLTKKFYKELSTWHAWAIDEVKFPNDISHSHDNEKYTHENVIRLVTRLIFVWFLKEKNLIPEEFFDEAFIREKLIQHFDPHTKDNLFFKPTESKYYRAILQNLFFATLNCPIVDERTGESNNRHFGGSGDGTNSKAMKYKDLFIDPQLFLDMVNQKVPFLNGGLFDCLDYGKRYFFDGFSEDDKISKHLCVPDYIFFGNEVGKDVDLSRYYGDKRKEHSSARGIIDILHQYKFTVEENTPYDQEVSLDPELLGKVFENLLAEYNPETGTTVRKSSGSYYTPREVVQYMVDESLVVHLKRTVDASLESTYRSLLSYSSGDIEVPDELRDAIIKSLYNCRVLDPACGSGAFPMGMLQQMVHILSRIDPSNKCWKELMIEVATNKTRIAFQTESQEERDERIKDINATFDENLNYPDYARKLYLIENCIYGVDIQPIAIQISHLRFFISLIVDQRENNNPKENFGIRPLPNLEAKFVAANSVVPLEKQMNLFSNSPIINALESKLREASHQFFKATPLKKAAWRKQIVDYRKKLLKTMVEEGFVTESAGKQIEGWDMFNQNASASFFDPEWMFGITDGFDIVIGNPPYIKEPTNRSAFERFRDTEYYMGKMDLWYGFACLGIDYLVDGGALCFIAQNNWTTSAGARILRNKVVVDTQIIQMIDFNEYMVFGDSASIQTMIMLFRKDRSIDDYHIEWRRLAPGAKNKDAMLDALYRKPTDNVQYLSPVLNRASYRNRYITFSLYDNLLDKIQQNNGGHLLSSELSQGVIFPQDFLNKKAASKLGRHYHIGDAVFAFKTSQMNALSIPQNEMALIKPYYTSSQIGRYFVLPNNDQWMIYTDSSFRDSHSLDSYPVIKKHLDRFQSIITSAFKPYGIHRARKNRFFTGEKIISLRKCDDRPQFAYCDFDCYFTQTFNSIKTNRWDMLFLTGLFNSRLIEFWLKHKGKKQGENFQVDSSELISIPIPDRKADEVAQIADLVKKINTKLAQDGSADISQYEKDIDVAVFHLYGLSYEEVRLVEPNFWITEQDYELQNKN